MQIYEVSFDLVNVSSEYSAQSKALVLAKSREHAIKVMYNNLDLGDSGDWEIVKIKASLARSQAARLL